MPHRRSASPYVTAVSGVGRERVKGRAHALPSSLLQLLSSGYDEPLLLSDHGSSRPC